MSISWKVNWLLITIPTSQKSYPFKIIYTNKHKYKESQLLNCVICQNTLAAVNVCVWQWSIKNGIKKSHYNEFKKNCLHKANNDFPKVTKKHLIFQDNGGLSDCWIFIFLRCYLFSTRLFSTKYQPSCYKAEWDYLWGLRWWCFSWSKLYICVISAQWCPNVKCVLCPCKSQVTERQHDLLTSLHCG